MPPRKTAKPAAPAVVDGVDQTDPSLALPDTPPAEPTPQPEGPAEPTPEELDLSAKHGITVDALRALRAHLAAELGAAVAAVENAGRDAAAAICGVHWPAGWPNDHAHTAHCEHGVWTR